MILGEISRTADTAVTLDDLFRRVSVRHPDALALADPPNREDFTDGAPRTLSFAQADRAISALAGNLRGLGLQTDTVVAMQLPNTVESIVAILGVLRAGMIAVPIPLLWRQQEIVEALRRVDAKAIVTFPRVGTTAHAELAMQAAVELFPIRHVCSFGPNLPDGIVSLDDVFASRGSDVAAPHTRSGPAAAHVAAITFGLDAKGFIPMARSHVELVAAGLETFLEAGAEADTSLLSAIPISSFAGLALTLVYWLLLGGALHLHHGFDPDAFDAQSGSLTGGTVVLPASALASVAEAGLLRGAHRTIVALWRAPERLASAKPWHDKPALVDVASFGEIGLVAARRGENRLPATIRHGIVNSSRRAPGAPVVIETACSGVGTLALRGRMVSIHAFAPGANCAHPPRLSPDSAGYVDTGFACRLDGNAQTLTITARPSGTIAVGGYCFRENLIDALVADADPDATLVALPDSDLGQRLAGTAADRTSLRAKLQAQGINPLISGAFQPRGAPEAA
ncbi:MAG TPA: class I adenylate-forming enzyme family protein [Pseudolabrys sp.]